ncbi:hypothetical protein BDK51DRAFT_33597, partial [Blyttiomyces helicus]
MTSPFASFGSTFFEVPPNTFSFDTLKSTLSAPVRRHVQQVYTQMAAMLVVIPFVGGGLLSSIAAVGLAVIFALTPATPKNYNTRLSLLYGFALAKGLSLGPLIGAFLFYNPSTLLTALVATSVLFSCFSASVLVAPSRERLYVSGFLSSAISVGSVLAIIGWFVRSEFMMMMQLYV